MVESGKERLVLLRQKIVEWKTKEESKTKELEDSIATVCEKWLKERERLTGEITEIDAEIAELERKLADKRREKEVHESARDKVVAEINVVKAGYKDREDEIAEIKGFVQDVERQQTESQVSLQSKQDQLQAQEQTKKANIASRNEVLQVATQAAQTAQAKQEAETRRITVRQKLREEVEAANKELYANRLHSSNLEKKREFYQEKAARSDSQVTEGVAQIMSQKVMLTKLEDEKKGYAAARKFKVELKLHRVGGVQGFERHQGPADQAREAREDRRGTEGRKTELADRDRHDRQQHRPSQARGSDHHSEAAKGPV
jgi:hypothetical protein